MTVQHVTINETKDPKIADKIKDFTATAAWKLQVKWRYWLTYWVPLKDLKASNPLELSEYAINNKIELKPALYW